jgi:hypothetical protein
MMRINGVCEYTETCEYEANKIHIRFDSLRSEYKKLRIRRTLVWINSCLVYVSGDGSWRVGTRGMSGWECTYMRAGILQLMVRKFTQTSNPLACYRNLSRLSH